MIIKKILFRVDGNAYIGAGHIMRCLAIAIAARDQGIECKFVSADDSFLKVIENNEFKVHILYSDYSRMEDELDKILNITEKEAPSVIFVDSYFVTNNYFTKLKEYTPIVYIDDIRLFAYKVDYLINYNAFAKYLDYSSYYRFHHIDLPHLILGEKYVPLRKEFQNLKELIPKDEVTDILFSAGGADPERIALTFASEVVRESKLNKYRFHLVLGAYEPDIKAITQLANDNPQLYIHKNVTKMSELMRCCDIAISAAGSTLYELCACGIPTITYILEDNQILGAKSLADKEVVINAGDFRTEKNFFQKLINLVSNLCSNHYLRTKMHDNAISTVDGYGAKNIIQELILLES